MRRFVALFILVIAAASLSTAASSAAPPADPAGGDASSAAVYVYWTELETGKIMRGPVDGGSPQTCVTGQSEPRGLVIGGQWMYWVERAAGRLRRADLNCPAGNIQTIGPTLINPDRMALDLAGGKIYWTENKEPTVTSNRIRRANLDGSGAETILDDSDVEEPVGIAIDRISNPPRLYWSDYGTDSIRMANLDGGNPQLVRQLADDMNPLEIGLDVANNTIYWASGSKGAIYYAPLTGGGGPQVWRTLGSPRSLTIDLQARRLYWGDHATDEVRRDTLNPSNNQFLYNADQPLGLALLYGTTDDCYALTRSHTGDGNNPTAAPGSSTGCAAGEYKAGAAITLTATPAAGWHVTGWSGTNNDAGTLTTNTVTMPATDHAVSVNYAPTCYTLTRTHSGNGNHPTASPAFSSGCGTGQFTAGAVITLTADPANGHHVVGWSNTNNDASTATTNTVTMPAANHTVSVSYEPIPIDCYPLNRSHTGSGSDPVASPAFSSGCGTGQYKAGEAITLTADPADGWHVAGWSNTNNDAGTATTNTVTMPGNEYSVSVAYEQDNNCHSLTRTHTGSGANPVAVPAFSSGCGTGQYTAGELITLTADPADGWHVAGWSNTNNDASTLTTNTVTMPANAHTVSVTYFVNGDSFIFFVPVVLYIPPAPPPCFAGPNEVEHNDSGATANGPLCGPGTYRGWPDDTYDFFMFNTTTAGRIRIDATELYGGGMQLALYYQTATGQPIRFDSEPDDGLSVELPDAQPGRYYARIYTETPNPAETRMYTMQVQFP